jgi:hypothetical protein
VVTSPVQGTKTRARIKIVLAEGSDHPEIYALRHQIYALELGQHQVNTSARLSDSLDAYNTYLKACVAGRLAGFVSITPPGQLARVPYASPSKTS